MDEVLDIVGFSADTNDSRVLKVHFRRNVTDADRAAFLEAINLVRKEKAGG